MLFEEKINIKYSQMDYKLILKPASLLDFLQDLASINAENLGFGYSFISQKNLGWFLLKYHMEFEDYPTSVYNLTLKTEPRGCNKLFAYRDFWLYDNEKLLGRVASTWSLVDMDTKALVPTQAVLNNDNMPAFVKREDDLIYKKIKPLEQINIEKIYEIRYDDIDVNRHANNCNYIVWALEPLTFDFRSSHKIKTIDMQFKKEIKFGEKILSQIQFINDDVSVHIIKNANTNDELCLIEIQWQKI